MQKIKVWLRLLRVKHYIKNGLVFFPLFFSREINVHNLVAVFSGSIIFSFISSIVYIINDMSDIEKDKIHPVKCRRPLPAGELSVGAAKAGIFVISIAIFMLVYIFRLNAAVSYITAGYLLLNIFYSRYAKNIPIADILILAAGYLMRIFYGAELIGVKVSEWLYLTVLFGALFLGLGKRRGELRYVDNGTSRKVLNYYNEAFLDKNMYLSLSAAIVFYALWCVSEEISLRYPKMPWTVIPVYAICMKYTLILEKGADGDPVSILFEDKFLLGMLAAFVCIIVWILYY